MVQSQCKFDDAHMELVIWLGESLKRHCGYLQNQHSENANLLQPLQKCHFDTGSYIPYTNLKDNPPELN